MLVLVLALLPALALGQATTQNDGCNTPCRDYANALGYCLGSLEYNFQQPDNDKAAEFVKCVCDGTKGSNEVLGADVMRNSIETCLGCPGTPNVVKDNLGELSQLCAGTSGNATDFAPFSYSVLTWNGNNDPNESGPPQFGNP